MGNNYWLDIKDFIAGIAFKIFLWGIGRTQEQYWKEVHEQEVVND